MTFYVFWVAAHVFTNNCSLKTVWHTDLNDTYNNPRRWRSRG